MTIELKSHIERQRAFSRATFGGGERTSGVCDHIRKELAEVEAEQTPEARASEWIDVVILAMDGAIRAFEEAGLDASDALPQAIRAKQRVNELRSWPDFRTMSENQAIEHDRTGE